MKSILIDKLLEHQLVTENVSVSIDGKQFSGWQITKPLNYDKAYITFKDRLSMAKKVLLGKAIVVQFFSDLTEDEKIAFVKSKIEANTAS